MEYAIIILRRSESYPPVLAVSRRQTASQTHSTMVLRGMDLGRWRLVGEAVGIGVRGAWSACLHHPQRQLLARSLCAHCSHLGLALRDTQSQEHIALYATLINHLYHHRHHQAHVDHYQPIVAGRFQSSLITTMGNDGGSIPKRRELVKNAARLPTVSELKATILETLGHAWSHCALSDDPLDKDAVIASDYRGKLYNYEAILNGLMNPPEEKTESTSEIRSLRDIVKLRFHKTGDKWTCPISMKELGPATKSVYLVPCGHVFADVAITEIQEKSCPECSEAFEKENVVAILPTTESEIQRLQTRMEDLRSKGLTHALKKDKSEKKKKRKTEEGDDVKNKKTKTEDTSRVKDINNPLAASLTARVMAEQEERNKQRKLAATKA